MIYTILLTRVVIGFISFAFFTILPFFLVAHSIELSWNGYFETIDTCRDIVCLVLILYAMQYRQVHPAQMITPFLILSSIGSLLTFFATNLSFFIMSAVCICIDAIDVLLFLLVQATCSHVVQYKMFKLMSTYSQYGMFVAIVYLLLIQIRHPFPSIWKVTMVICCTGFFIFSIIYCRCSNTTQNSQSTLNATSFKQMCINKKVLWHLFVFSVIHFVLQYISFIHSVIIPLFLFLKYLILLQ